MIDLNSVLSEIEADLAWREAELRYFENPLSLDIDIDAEEKILETKPLILFLYAHFEGHAKLMLTVYVKTLNNCQLECKNLTFPLIASSLHSEFGALKNASKTHPLFPKTYEPNLKELGRRVEFFENLNEILSQKLELNIDNIVDTESNLKPIVLKKIFFRLGFDLTRIDDNDFSKIQRLLKLRNGIAHGSQMDGISFNEYKQIKDIIWKILREIKNLIIDYLSNEKFCRPNSLSLTA